MPDYYEIGKSVRVKAKTPVHQEMENPVKVRVTRPDK
jgi:hypothetical protein